jgi:hypothetical protein
VIRNPVLPGFSPDPSILRVGSEYYIDASRLADEPLRRSTGTMIGSTCQDAFRRSAFADFAHLRLEYPSS